ncbi:Holliday junction branch migration protein RuvA [Pseudomonadota bacterium]
MIGKIRGIVDTIGEEFAIIDVHGLGYRVFCSSKTLGFLEGKKEEVSLLIETNVKEDHIHLYGFLTEEEKRWFSELCKVSGIGNKVAIKIMGTLDTDEMHFAISSGDYKSFTRAPGVGKKVAERIITELKTRVPKFDGGSISSISVGLSDDNSESKINQNTKLGIISDAVSALESLGYDRSYAYKICVEKYNKNCNITLENLVTESLRDLSSLK